MKTKVNIACKEQRPMKIDWTSFRMRPTALPYIRRRRKRSGCEQMDVWLYWWPETLNWYWCVHRVHTDPTHENMLHYACVCNEHSLCHLMGKFHLFSARNFTRLAHCNRVCDMMNVLFNRSTNYAREHRIKRWHLFLCVRVSVSLWFLTKMREAQQIKYTNKMYLLGVSLMPKIHHKRSCLLAHSMSRCSTRESAWPTLCTRTQSEKVSEREAVRMRF